MAWFSGKVSLGNFPDFSDAVNKLSESVKSIEKNFDNALGLDEKSDATNSEASGIWPSSTIMGFMGQKSEDNSNSVESDENEAEIDSTADQASEQIAHGEEANKKPIMEESEEDIQHSQQKQKDDATEGTAEEAEVDSPVTLVKVSDSQQTEEQSEKTNSPENFQKESSEIELPESLESVQPESTNIVGQDIVTASSREVDDSTGAPESINEQHEQGDIIKEVVTAQVGDESPKGPAESSELAVSDSPKKIEDSVENSADDLRVSQHSEVETNEGVTDVIAKSVHLEQSSNKEFSAQESINTGNNTSDNAGSVADLEKLKKEMKMMETALQGAAKQAQLSSSKKDWVVKHSFTEWKRNLLLAKADEIAKLMNENEHLKAVIDDLRGKTNEEIESLREEYHQRVAALERKVYSLTKERDTLRREQNKKSDAAALLKEKDEIITQVMAEGEELSKKQAAQEAQIRKLRAQIREFEEEKKVLLTKLQAEENKVESIKRDKAATEKLLQESIENHQSELVTQKEYYTNALNAAKEAEALAEARANSEARTEMESRLREAGDRESMLVQTLEELRQTLSRTEQQAVFREDMLRRDVEDLQKRYQASERRCEELITQVPESTRPLLRQIEAMQETAARRVEAWAAVEKSLNSRLQEAESKAATAEEKERSINERLTQTLSRINVLEAQISCLRTEQTQLTRSLEKERQKASESRQEYLALKEESDTHEGRVNQLEEEIKQLRKKHKEEMHEVRTHQELLQQELDREKAARLDLERASRLQSSAIPDQSSLTKQKSAALENGNLTRRLSSQSSLSSMEESYFLQTTLDSSDNVSEHRSTAEGSLSPYYMKNMTSGSYEAALRQREGELASYMSRLASMESIRDSLAEELVKMTAQCEKLRAETATVPGIRAELEALRRRHSAALELMGERDEELEELRADIVDLKEMYREQVNLLVNKIQTIGTAR